MLKISFNACLFTAVVLTRCAVSGSAADLEPAQLARLHRALEPLHKQFDPNENMLVRPFSSPGYHTTLTGGLVLPPPHCTRVSFF